MLKFGEMLSCDTCGLHGSLAGERPLVCRLCVNERSGGVSVEVVCLILSKVLMGGKVGWEAVCVLTLRLELIPSRLSIFCFQSISRSLRRICKLVVCVGGCW